MCVCVFLSLFCILLQQDEVGDYGATAEMEANILDETQGCYDESHVEEMESQDSSPDKTE